MAPEPRPPGCTCDGLFANRCAACLDADRAVLLARAAVSRERHAARLARLEREAQARAKLDAERKVTVATPAAVAAALARARARRAGGGDGA